MGSGGGEYPDAKPHSCPVLTAHKLASQKYMKNVDIHELGAIAHGDLALYPSGKTMKFLRNRDAEKGYAPVAERKERILADGLALAEQCADMWVKLRDLKYA